VEDGSFRSDLYHRLKVVTILIPNLQERSADIPLLIEHFMKQFAKRHQKPIKGMSRAARVKLLAFSWPGNVRQLRNVIESMVVVDCDETLDVDDLPAELDPEAGHEQAVLPDNVEKNAGITSLIGRPLDEIEKIFIGETLKLAGGNREQTAEMLGIGERTLYRKIKEYKLH
jgi:two-component system response regulator HydG